MIQIEKCSSPTGDGKFARYNKCDMFFIEKCSSPTGDGNFCIFIVIYSILLIEKCSSPTGDGNLIRSSASVLVFPD